jgi:hypothetical protein
LRIFELKRDRGTVEEKRKKFYRRKQRKRRENILNVFPLLPSLPSVRNLSRKLERERLAAGCPCDGLTRDAAATCGKI